MRILAITREADDPATRYRLGLHRPGLARLGIDVWPMPWPASRRERYAILDSARDYDAVVVFRCLMPIGQLIRLRRNARWLAFDFDDNPTRRDSTKGYPWLLLDKVVQFRAMAALADALTPGNTTLAELARYYGARQQIEIVPTAIDLARYPFPPPPIEDVRLTIGWIGQPSTLPYLKDLRPIFRLVYEEQKPVVMRVIGASRSGMMKEIDTEEIPWSPATEVRDLQSLQIGLAPLPDDAWTRGKCGLRLLQYLAAGVPSIASPVGVQREIIAFGGSLSATTEDEWSDAIRELAAHPERRAELARRGREIVESRFTPEHYTTVLARLWSGQEFGPAES
ncbi:glycosyltransferase family 4 protein [bacterium]|nr:glycosyltransferase family 4 protein [bacterium]